MNIEKMKNSTHSFANRCKWGNRHRIGKNGVTAENCLTLHEADVDQQLAIDPRWLEPLRGYNLACFCSLLNPCPVDVLLRLLYDV